MAGLNYNTLTHLRGTLCCVIVHQPFPDLWLAGLHAKKHSPRHIDTQRYRLGTETVFIPTQVLAPEPGNRRRQGAGSREHNIGSVMACPVLLSQQMGGAADDHLHDIQWLQGSVSSSYMLSL